IQGGDIPWSQFSIMTLKSNPVFARIVEALDRKSELQISYSGGSRPGEPRTIMPLGIVRNLDDDFLVAQDEPNAVPKRYFLKRIIGSAL
ncbi:MAG: exonuclease, partial [Bdellovibrionota bacterium]